MNTSWARLYSFAVSLLMVALGLNIAPSHAAVLTSFDETALRAAVSAGGLVTFPGDGTITLTNTIALDRDVKLDGMGHWVTISGGKKVRLFNVATNVRAAFINLTLANGWHVGTNGGTLDGEAAFGGAIYNDGGTVDLVSCVLSNNVARGGDNGLPPQDAGMAQGGAVYNAAGWLNITNTVFADNQAIGGNMSSGSLMFPSMAGDALGGAIGSVNGHVVLDHARFERNTTLPGNAYFDFFPLGWYGMATNVYGGAVYGSGGSVVCVQTVFAQNRVESPARGFSNLGGGGAISLTKATLACAESRFFSNQVTAGTQARGGAIFLQQTPTILTGCVYSGNSTSGGESSGGALFCEGEIACTGCTFETNSAHNKGGAIHVQGSLAMAACTLAGNVASGGNAYYTERIDIPARDGGGGGIFASGNLHLTNTTFVGNVAQGGSGVGFVDFMYNTPGGRGQGGALYQESGTADLVNLTLAFNRAAGGAGDPAGLGTGGGLYSTNSIINLWNTILAYSPTGSNAFGVITDMGYNLSSDGSCNFTNTGSLNNTDPQLGPLADHGGSTMTMPLLTGSPCLDAGDDVCAPAADQRGVARPQGVHSEIGAFELEARRPTLAVAISDAKVRIAVTGAEAGAVYSVLRATSINDRWTEIGTFTVTNSTGQFIDTLPPEGGAFYRTRKQ